MLYVNGNPITCGKFPNGETYVDFDTFKNIPRISHIEITMRYENNDDIINLILLKGSLDDMGFKSISLKTPFFPYETMDRTQNMRALSAKHIARLINSMNFTNVEIWEPHSDVILAVLDRVIAKDMSDVIANSIMGDNLDDVLVVFPDAGAAKRYKDKFPEEITAVMSKTRDFKTGHLVYNGFVGETPIITDNTRVIIVDDLCRKGMTFVLAAECLRNHGAKSIELAVTHCENTIHDGLIPVAIERNEGLIKKVYTTDSILTKTADWIEIVYTII